MKYVPIALLTIFFCSCQDIEVLSEEESSIVVEGFIEADSYPVVIVTTPLNIDRKEHEFEEIGEHILKWGLVKIVCEGDTVVLTGKYDKGYLPPYIYTTTEIMGEEGKEYTLLIDYRNQHVEAKTTIPQIPDVSDFRLIKHDNFMGYEAMVLLKDKPEEKNYYASFVRVGKDTRQYTLSHLGLIDDVDVPQDEPTSIIINGGHQFNGKFHRYFYNGEYVGVKFSQIDSVSYECLSDFQDNILFAQNMFLPANRNMRTNIKGGCGFWCGLASRKWYFVVGEGRLR